MQCIGSLVQADRGYGLRFIIDLPLIVAIEECLMAVDGD